MKKPPYTEIDFPQFLTLVSQMSGLDAGKKPESLYDWQPENCGDIGLEIAKDGAWYQNHVKFTREKLVRLFSTIMRVENDGKTYLVTPVEKVIIKVHDAHFIAIRCDFFDGENKKIVFTTNIGDQLILGENCDLEMREKKGEKRPYLLFERGLTAILSRPVFYELVEKSTVYENIHGLWSNDRFYGLE